MAAAAVSSLACPLRRSTRLAHAHSHINPPPSRIHHHRLAKHRPRPTPDPDQDQDSSSSDPENELTPRALRALKRQRLALDPDGLPLTARTRPKKRRKQSFSVDRPPASPSPDRPSTHRQASLPYLLLPHSSIHSPHHASTNDPVDVDHRALATTPPNEPSILPSKPELAIPDSTSCPDPSSPEPLTPLTPLTPSPSPSPSLPGHDRHILLLSPLQDPLPPPVSLDTLPLPSSPEPTPAPLSPLPTDSFPPPPPTVPSVSLDPALDTLIPFDNLHPQFPPELSVQIPPSACQPTTPPSLQGLELQDQFHSFPQPQLYVPPNPVFVRDREINIWKLACQERVDCLLRRYGIDYIKALVESEARSLSKESRSSPLSSTHLGPLPTSQTKFRLYTPASYTYSATSWGSTSSPRKPPPLDDDGEDVDSSWPTDDPDWVDADVDMEDDDDDDYEDDDDPPETEAEREGEATLEAVESLVITDTPTRPVSKTDTQATVDDVPGKSEMMELDSPRLAIKPTVSLEPISTADASPRPPSSLPHSYMTPPTVPPLSSLHVPLLSEPPRAFMGRGTPPDRRRLVEWSGSGRFGMGPPLYLSPAPQRHASADVGIVPMSVESSMHSTPPPPHTHGEWTSFLYSMLEGDGVGTAVGAPHAPEPPWYELGLAPPVVPENGLALPLHSHPHAASHGRASGGDPTEEGNSSSSTLRFALG